MKLKKMILTVAAVLSLAVCPFHPVSAAYISNQMPSTAQDISAAVPMSDNYVWVYKVKEGKLYKHLYNSSKNMWIGPWIYVCDYPE